MADKAVVVADVNMHCPAALPNMHPMCTCTRCASCFPPHSAVPAARLEYAAFRETRVWRAFHLQQARC